MRENGVGPNGTESTRWKKREDEGQHSTTLQKMTERRRRLQD